MFLSLLYIDNNPILSWEDVSVCTFFGNTCCLAACYSRARLTWPYHQQHNSKSGKACTCSWALKCVANCVDQMQNALLMQACICGTSKSATCRPTKAALFVSSLSKVCQLESMLADLGHLLTNTAGLLAHKVKTWSVHIYKPTSACMLPSTQFCAVTFVKIENRVYAAGRATIGCRGCTWSPAWASHWSYPVRGRWPSPPTSDTSSNAFSIWHLF